ncbi:MAG: hypothetical protein GY829_03430 [Gammaproteobacteria bacterium]|nr:hypothetical protein [Gammaproteobacteria bacterium]
MDSETLLHRLFHQESITNLAIDPAEFCCSCSQVKMLNSLSLLGEDEIKEILEEDGEVAMTCEFCLEHFSFSEIDINKHHGQEGHRTQH